MKHLTELFSFLLDFAKLGDQEAEFLLSIQAISTCVEFYLKTCGGASAIVADPELEVSDDDESEEDVIALPLGGTGDTAAARIASLDKMVSLIALLVERSRAVPKRVSLGRDFELYFLMNLRLKRAVSYIFGKTSPLSVSRCILK